MSFILWIERNERENSLIYVSEAVKVVVDARPHSGSVLLLCVFYQNLGLYILHCIYSETPQLRPPFVPWKSGLIWGVVL